MKKTILTTLLVLSSISTFGQEFFFNTEKGTKCLYVNRDASGNVINSFTEKVENVSIGNEESSIVFSYDYFTPDGKSYYDGKPLEMKGTIKDGKTSVKMSPLAKAMKAPDFMVKGDISAIPVHAKKGDRIPDHILTITVGVLKVKSQIKNTVVTGEEQITTPAGTFDCIVVTGQETLQGETVLYKSYLSKGFGTIKQEIRTTDGKLIRTMTLEKRY